jgi:hypothetical protein
MCGVMINWCWLVFWVLGQFFGTRLHVLPRDQTGPEPYSTTKIWTQKLNKQQGGYSIISFTQVLGFYKPGNENFMRKVRGRLYHFSGQSEAAPTSAPTWMDGALIGFSFLSLCHPRLTFFSLHLSQPRSQFFLQLNFLPAPHPVSFFFLLLKLFPPIDLLPSIVPQWPTHLYIYIWKKVVCLFCFVLFVLMRSTKMGCFRSRSWSLWKVVDKERCMHGLCSMTFGLAV